MPIFEYHCATCNNDFELLVFGDQTVTCPACQGTNVKKMLSACSVKSGDSFSSSAGSGCSSCSATTCKGCSS